MYGFDTPTDCNGDCFGEAVTGCKGFCVLGNTNRSADFGKSAELSMFYDTNSLLLDNAKNALVDYGR